MPFKKSISVLRKKWEVTEERRAAILALSYIFLLQLQCGEGIYAVACAYICLHVFRHVRIRYI
jgi:hypothetical protein